MSILLSDHSKALYGMLNSPLDLSSTHMWSQECSEGGMDPKGSCWSKANRPFTGGGRRLTKKKYSSRFDK